MRNLLFAFIMIISIGNAYADAWDDLSKAQAEAVVKELKKNPYVFDYCDCCGNHDDLDIHVAMLKVDISSIKIVECDWKKEAFTVTFNTIGITTWTYTREKLFDMVSFDQSDLAGETKGLKLFMNYTWGFSKKGKNGRPFFEIVDYSSNYGGKHKPCVDISIVYPTPKQLKKEGGVASKTEVKLYKKWYKTAMKK